MNRAIAELSIKALAGDLKPRLLRRVAESG
ncbi:hypothetical protein J2S66_000175 [Saccharothrix longispora]|uniref:Uncharacterized protein n=1 Tax=Saccharothrix longispora TaxID=33920 RepID=A0ABU1PMK9_9PSEU|nr:hypothetical protein [Saccharothrix longispora]